MKTNNDHVFPPKLAGVITRGRMFSRPVKVTNCLCPDGRRRVVQITGEPDTIFSAPAKVQYCCKNVTGYVTPVELSSTVIPPESEVWRDMQFCPSPDGANAVMFKDPHVDTSLYTLIKDDKLPTLFQYAVVKTAEVGDYTSGRKTLPREAFTYSHPCALEQVILRTQRDKIKALRSDAVDAHPDHANAKLREAERLKGAQKKTSPRQRAST